MSEKYFLGSVCIFIYKTFDHCQQQDLDVQHDGPVFDIIEVAVDAEADGGITPVAVDLCPAGDAWTDLVFDHIAGDLFFELFNEKGSFRPWSHKAHVSLEYIEKLGKFVQTCLADEFSDGGNPRVVRSGPGFFLIRRLLDRHRAEFVHHKGFAVETDPLLFEDQFPFRGGLYDNRNYQHRQGKQHNEYERTGDIHCPLYKFIKRIGEGYIPHMDDRKPVQIFGIRLGGDDIVVVRYKFGVHTGFFRNGDDPLQAFILVDAQGDGDLVIGIVGKNGLQIVDITDDMDIPVGFSISLAVVKDTVDDVAPFRMGTDAVDITLGGTSVANQENVFEIVPFLAETAEDRRDEQPEKKFENKIDPHKYNDKKTGVVAAADKIKTCGTIKDPDNISLENIIHLGFAARHPLGIVQMEKIIGK